VRPWYVVPQIEDNVEDLNQRNNRWSQLADGEGIVHRDMASADSACTNPIWQFPFSGDNCNESAVINTTYYIG
jgi:hypothetical protein